MAKIHWNTEDAEASWHPVIHDPTSPEERLTIGLLRADPHVFVHDTIAKQLDELVDSRHPDRALSAPERAELVRKEIGDRELIDYGRWILFPWSRRLVHLLPPDDYVALRTDRNHHKISPDEQRSLRRRAIGVLGLSVGQATAVTLAMEGVGGFFRLADFDLLSVSNMNRLRSGVHNVGTAKVILAAREIFEIDPYVEIEIFPTGLDEQSLDAFLTGAPRLDLLVEECDDLSMKIRVRERARQERIPVVMETSDRGMIDVERFDLEPERPLLHGLVGDLRADEVREMSTMEKIPYVMRILDDQRVSPRLAASILEVRRTISTWPQLASGVALGGAVVTDVARRILLHALDASGRYYVDLERLVAPGAAVEVTRAPMTAELPTEPRTRAIPRPAKPDGAELSRAEVEYLVHHATLAPSEDNAQPWRFEWTGNVLRAYLSPPPKEATGSEVDAGAIALGAAAENLELAAGALGLAATIEGPAAHARSSGSGVVFEVRFARRADAAASPLFAAVAERATNRKIGTRHPLSASQRSGLLEEARACGVDLVLVDDDARLADLGKLLSSAERLRFLTPALHRRRTEAIRWTASDADAARTGLDVATLELDRTRLAFLRLTSRDDAMETLRRVEGGHGLGMTAAAEIAACSAVGLLRAKTAGAAAQFHGGRAMQRLWLRATTSGLALQPYDLISLLRAWSPGSTSSNQGLAAQVASDYARIFPPTSGTDVMVFRVATGLPPPSALSLRRRLDHVLFFVR